MKKVPKYMFIYLYIKLAIVVKGDPNAPFSISTTPNRKRGRCSFP